MAWTIRPVSVARANMIRVVDRPGGKPAQAIVYLFGHLDVPGGAAVVCRRDRICLPNFRILHGHAPPT